MDPDPKNQRSDFTPVVPNLQTDQPETPNIAILRSDLALRQSFLSFIPINLRPQTSLILNLTPDAFNPDLRAPTLTLLSKTPGGKQVNCRICHPEIQQMRPKCHLASMAKAAPSITSESGTQFSHLNSAMKQQEPVDGVYFPGFLTNDLLPTLSGIGVLKASLIELQPHLNQNWQLFHLQIGV